ncbi:hypothetical protein BUQ74_11745 [Leptospira weilii serovar Heyan]|nr:hypothetical protein LEP1GSC086_4515 [Leptospira weilii str. LNT 1234]OMI17141.1 hypothetical protein BUQ74_11745 [Leptospira weilii serovar Heyan]
MYFSQRQNNDLNKTAHIFVAQGGMKVSQLIDNLLLHLSACAKTIRSYRDRCNCSYVLGPALIWRPQPEQ